MAVVDLVAVVVFWGGLALVAYVYVWRRDGLEWD